MNEYMAGCGLDAFLVTGAENIRYLSGFSGGSDARLVISRGKRYILTDARYFQQVEIECPGWQLIEDKPDNLEGLKELCADWNKIGFESRAVSYRFYQELERDLPGRMIAHASAIEDLRMIKDEDELRRLREAARIGDQVFTAVGAVVKPGLSEQEVAAEIVYRLLQMGCERIAFDTIAVAGANAALPHGRPGPGPLSPGDMLTLDFGGVYQGYAGDMTRTIAIGHADSLLRQRYQILLEAQLCGLDAVKSGAACRDVDLAVRNCLQKYELERYFQHSTGHGVGLEVHEMPALSRRSEQTLRENMVVTVEPGIYIPGWGGIRIEDTVIVTKRGCEIITHSDKNLTII